MASPVDTSPGPPVVVKHDPEELGMYIIVSDIAAGTFGTVKKAIHKVTGHRVALKFLSKAAVANNGMKTRVRREFEYTRMLRHPHIIKLYEIITTPEEIVFVLEYAEGELFVYIRDHGPLDEDLARRFFQQIIAGVEYTHRQKIIHRDLKPENILLDEYSNVKIGDFGLSKEAKDGEFLTTSCGSPNYAAPEVIRGDRYSGPDADVWSSGVILYVLLCNQLPFEDENITELFEKIKTLKYDLPTHLNPLAQNLIRSMLVLDPFQRITIPEIMKHPWFTVDLPRYLTPLPPIPGAVVGTLSSLVAPPVVPLDRDLEYVEGLGRIDDEVVDELVELLEGVDKEEVLHSLRRDDGSRGNQVKVAYMLLQDKRRVGKDLAIVSELEREAELASMDPRNVISPNAVSPNGGDVDENPFEAEFEEDIDDVDDEFIDLAEDEVDVPSRFSILGSSLPAPEVMNTGRRRHKKRSKWQFGIRSSSPPLKVLKEIYAQLKAMDMEWKYRHDLSDIFCIEARARVRDFVILMNINLYDTKQHLGLEYYRLDFVHKKSYRASTLPGAGKYDAAPREGSESESITRSYARSVFTDGLNDKKTILSPFIFMELAAELILNLAASNAND